MWKSLKDVDGTWYGSKRCWGICVKQLHIHSPFQCTLMVGAVDGVAEVFRSAFLLIVASLGFSARGLSDQSETGT